MLLELINYSLHILLIKVTETVTANCNLLRFLFHHLY